MPADTILYVALSVTPERETAFTDFYHHRYIPRLLEVFPEITGVRRYVEDNVDGSLRYYTKRHLTFYEFADAAAAERCHAELATRPGREAERAQWQAFLADGLFDVEPACLYRQRYAHPRTPWDGPFGSRPFFMVAVEVRPEAEDAFNAWYEGRYLPCNLADVPLWAACRRYESVGRSPRRAMTLYEAADAAGLLAALELMRAPHRMAENASWKEWDQGADPAITWEDATSFRPVYRFPG
ncbi:hypothetical protein [Azospirillum sp. A39]|uniref:hypothetical protein n=1 Tax=Azospirillum sp. A39 TaxID=3462279 RepID=UPI004045F310